MNNQTKICWDCKEELPLSAFNKDTSSCSTCKKQYNKKYRTIDYTCVVCESTMRLANKARHNKTQMHQVKVAGQQKF